MSVSFSDRLDAALASLRAAGCTSMLLTADAAAIEAIFRERGDQAILFDADKTREVAWYAGDCEVLATRAPVPVLSYSRDLERFMIGLDETTPPILPGTEAREPAAVPPAEAETPSARAAA